MVCSACVAGAQATAHTENTGPAFQLQQAIAAAQLGDENGALGLTRTLVVQHPDYAPALKLQGALLEQMG